jgi:hypothetical protein
MTMTRKRSRRSMFANRSGSIGEEESGAARLVGERRTVQFVTRLLSRMVLRCLGDGRS